LGYRIEYRPRDRGPEAIKEIYIRDSNVDVSTNAEYRLLVPRYVANRIYKLHSLYCAVITDLPTVK
jgi:hypothetical protein